MTRSRGVRSSLGRGALAVAANPGLVLAPVLVATATLAALLLSLLSFFLAMGLSVLRDILSSFRRGAEAGFHSLDGLVSGLLGRPGPLLVAVLVATVLLTLVLLLAAALRAGTIAVFVEVDRRAPEGASRALFHLAWGEVFREGARRSTAPLFWLLNVYALAVTLLILVLAIGVAAIIGAAAFGKGLAPAVVLFLVAIPIFLVGAFALQLGLMSCEWAIVAHGLGMVDGIARGLSRLRETLGRSLGLFLIVLLIAMGVGGALSVPRVAATFLVPHAPHAIVPFMVVIGVCLVVEMVASYYMQLFMTSVFVSLWAEVSEVAPAAPAAAPPPPSEPPVVPSPPAEAPPSPEEPPALEGTA